MYFKSSYKLKIILKKNDRYMLEIFNSYWRNKKRVFVRIFIVNVSYYLTENRKIQNELPLFIKVVTHILILNTSLFEIDEYILRNTTNCNFIYDSKLKRKIM